MKVVTALKLSDHHLFPQFWGLRESQRVYCHPRKIEDFVGDLVVYFSKIPDIFCENSGMTVLVAAFAEVSAWGSRCVVLFASINSNIFQRFCAFCANVGLAFCQPKAGGNYFSVIPNCNKGTKCPRGE